MAYPDPAAIVSELQTWLAQGAWVIALVGRPPYALELAHSARPLESKYGAIAATPGPKFELPHHAVVVAAADPANRTFLLLDPWFPQGDQPILLSFDAAPLVLAGELLVCELLERLTQGGAV